MVPVVFCADKIDYLLRQPFFMARKLSPYRATLFDALDKIWRGERAGKSFSDDEMGLASNEYETIRLRNRDGAPGVPVVGKPLDGWADGLDRVPNPFFAVLGSSVAELRLAYALLSRRKGLMCHGQLLHPTVIEFHCGTKSIAGFRRDDLALRAISASHFLANVIRGSGQRQSGFLLRLGHGWHVPEVLFTVPAAKVIVIYGDPLVGFVESMTADDPLIDDPLTRPLCGARRSESWPRRSAITKRAFGKERNGFGALVAQSRPKGEPPVGRGWSKSISISPNRRGWKSPCEIKKVRPTRETPLRARHIHPRTLHATGSVFPSSAGGPWRLKWKLASASR